MFKPQEKEDIHLVFEGLGIAGNIYLSNAKAAYNSLTLKCIVCNDQAHSIMAVISAGKGLNLEHHHKTLKNYLYLPVEDREDQNIEQYFGTTFEFIDKNRKKGNILVHCYKGVSRSATVVAAYLIKKYSYSLSQAVNLLREKRKKVNPNRGFIRQLHNYSLQLKQQKQLTKQSESSDLFVCNMLKDLQENQEKVQEQLRTTRQTISKSIEKRHRSASLKDRIKQAMSTHRLRKISTIEVDPQRDLNSLMALKLKGQV